MSVLTRGGLKPDCQEGSCESEALSDGQECGPPGGVETKDQKVGNESALGKGGLAGSGRECAFVRPIEHLMRLLLTWIFGLGQSPRFTMLLLCSDYCGLHVSK
jgi:hypothetical protein